MFFLFSSIHPKGKSLKFTVVGFPRPVDLVSAEAQSPGPVVKPLWWRSLGIFPRALLEGKPVVPRVRARMVLCRGVKEHEGLRKNDQEKICTEFGEGFS